MALFVDCAVVADVARMRERFPLAGVTTNPSILRAALEAGQRLDDLAVLRELAALGTLDVMAQPVGETAEALYATAMRYVEVAPKQVTPKILLTPAGLGAGVRLKQHGTRVAFTCVSTLEQAYCAAEAGADWIIPYVGRLRRAGVDPAERIARLGQIARLNPYAATHLRILAASVKSAADVVEATLAGAHDVTASPEVLESLLADPLTDAAYAQFEEDWRRFQLGLGRA